MCVKRRGSRIAGFAPKKTPIPLCKAGWAFPAAEQAALPLVRRSCGLLRALAVRLWRAAPTLTGRDAFSPMHPPGDPLLPWGAIHLVPPGKADRTGSAPVPQGHFRACPAGLGTGTNAARAFRQAVGASSSLLDAPTFSCLLHGFSQKLSLDQHVCSIYNNRTPVRI